MSIISECLRQILSARYGKDVRQSIHDGIKELDEVARTAQGSATLSAQTAIEKANEALTASQAAIESAQQAKAYSDNAQAVAGVQVATQDNAGLVKGGENHIGLDGTLELVVKTTEASMPNSRKGRLAVDEIGGVCVQDNIPSPELPQEIKKSVVSEIKTHRKNFLKNNHEKETISNGLTFITNDDGTITINGTATANTNYNLGGSENPRLSGLYQNLVQISGTFNGEVNHMAFTKTWGDGGGFQIGKPKPLKENLVYMYFRMVITAGTVCNNLVVGFMICEDLDSSYSYEPYTESVITLSQPIDLYGIGDVKDVIEDGKIVRKFASIVYDGDESWYAENHYFRISKSGVDSKIPVLCTHFQQTKDYSVVNSTNGTGTLYVGSSNFSINMKGICDTVAELKTWLASNPITMVYGIAEEVIEELPLADQIALNSLKTFDGVTYLEFDSEVQPTFAGKYGASLVGGAALEGAMKARANSLVLNGDSFEFAEHGLTFKGLKVGKMVTVQVSGALDYAITEENKVKIFDSVIPEGFRPIATTHASSFSITSKDSDGNRVMNMFDLAVGGSGAIQIQVELRDSVGQIFTNNNNTGMPLHIAISYISE